MDTPENRVTFEKELLRILPDLKKFARSLTKNGSAADDLVQDTVVRALRAYWQFEIGSNMKAYVFRIMQNCFRSDLRVNRTQPLPLAEDTRISVPAGQDGRMELRDVVRAFDRLVPAHREVISLIRVDGLSYHDAAGVMRCGLGTVKSRMNRADAALRAALGPDFRRSRTSCAEAPGKHHYLVAASMSGAAPASTC